MGPLYLVRHGETQWNRQRRLQGRDDSPLTLRGIELTLAYAHRLRAELAGVGGALEVAEAGDAGEAGEAGDAGQAGAARIHVSPLWRARQTAALVSDVLCVPDERIRVDPLLAEHDVGEWSGHGWEEIERRYGVGRHRLREWDLRPPGGETRREMVERARRWLAQPREAGPAVVVSHGGFSRCLRGAFLGLDCEAMAELAPHDHGRLYRLDAAGVTELTVEVGPLPTEAALG